MSTEMYFGLEKKFESECLLPYMEKLSQQVSILDYLGTKLTTHKLKGVAAYMGASHIFYICEIFE